jgi:hypothetical protein
MRRVITFAVVTLCAAEARAEPPKTLYELSSPDVGQAWHLHAKDGTFVCALPCEASVGEHSGDYLVVHEDDAKKVWRVNLPSSEDAARVSMTARVGKGSPALGTFGEMLAVGGAAAGLSGVAMLVVSLINVTTGCGADVDPAAPCTRMSDGVTYAAIGAPLAVGGTILAMVGLYLTDHNKSASSHIVITPTSIAGRL